MGRTMTDSQLEYIREAPDSVRMVHDLLKELDAEREVSRKLAEGLQALLDVSPFATNKADELLHAQCAGALDYYKESK